MLHSRIFFELFARMKDTDKNIIFDFHKIRWYIVESNCKVNFARGFLFEVVITKQVRSKSGNQLEKREFEDKKRKEILKVEKRRRRREFLRGHKIKRSSMYIFNLSYGSKEWFSVLKWWKKIFSFFEDIRYLSNS